MRASIWLAETIRLDDPHVTVVWSPFIIHGSDSVLLGVISTGREHQEVLRLIERLPPHILQDYTSKSVDTIRGHPKRSGCRC